MATKTSYEVKPQWKPIKVGMVFRFLQANGKWRTYRCDSINEWSGRAKCHPLDKKAVTIKGKTFYALDGKELSLSSKASVREYLQDKTGTKSK